MQHLTGSHCTYRYCFSATAIEGMAVCDLDRGPAITAKLTRLLRPILTPKTVLPLFFAIGIIFAPIGGLLLYASAQVSGTFAHFEWLL